jgi:hypothetical protein
VRRAGRERSAGRALSMARTLPLQLQGIREGLFVCSYKVRQILKEQVRSAERNHLKSRCGALTFTNVCPSSVSIVLETQDAHA